MMICGKNRILRVILPIIGILFFSGVIPAYGVTRIMPLGDSITRGYWGSPVNQWGYRKPLYDLLISDGYDFDFVGSCVSGSFPDPSHEGHDGWRTDQILSQVNGWLVSYQPDVVLLHIGTNDITQGYHDANQVNAILNAVDGYEAASGRTVTVILALIINRRIDSPSIKRSRTTQFNSDVSDIAMNRIANGDDIIIVDMESALNYNIGADMADEVHPNDAGYAKMAQVWHGALTNYFDEFIFTISGHVLEPDGNTPVEGMFIRSDNNDVNAVTDANGFYELQVNYDWSGVATPQKNGYIFEPNGYVYSNVNQDLTNRDYIAAPKTFMIAGFVFEQNSITPISGVNVSADNGGGSAITDANGYYEIVVDFNWSGNVTPGKYAHGFEPNSKHYKNVNHNYAADQNYSGTEYDLRIYGYVRNGCNVPIEGVQVDATDGAISDATDSNGFYEVWVDAGWSGTVTPAKKNYTFVPTLVSYTDVQADQPKNYTAGNIYDLDCDGLIGWGDLMVMADNWLSTDPGAAGNFVVDERVDFRDFALFASVWLDK
jgi:lysophospholipase L1-like esterase